jgi:hypothetical protein
MQFSTLTLADFGYSPLASRFISASYRHKIPIDQPMAPLHRTFGLPVSFALDVGGHLKDGQAEPVITATFSGKAGENRLSTMYMPRTQDAIVNFSSSELLEGTTFRASFGDTLVSRQDYVAIDQRYSNGSSTFKFDSTGTVSTAAVLSRKGLSVGAEVVAPTRFAVNYIAERKKVDETECNFGVEYRRTGDYPWSLSLTTKKQASSYLLTYHQELTAQAAVAVQLDSEESNAAKYRASNEEHPLQGWSIAGKWNFDPQWTLRAKVLADNTAAVSVQTTAMKNTLITAGVRCDITGGTNFRYGVNATLFTD